MILNIRKDGDPVLRQKAELVTRFDFDLQVLIDNMIETMRSERGIGLAAPQVGVSKQIFICEFANDEGSEYEAFPLTVICNPKIVKASKRKCKMVEGCLSFPGREILIKRPESVIISGQDRYGKKIKIEAKGLFARVLQHEFDHLSSTLFVDHIRETRVIFIGTGSLGVKSLKALISDLQYKIVAVVTGNKTTLVHGREVANNQILDVAKAAGLHIIQTNSVKSPEVVEKIAKLEPELGVMADFGQIIPETILAIPKYGIINIHPSLLPRHRGASPVKSTILAGDETTGVTLMLTVAKMDAGPIISQAVIDLTGSETSTILKDYLAEVGSLLLLESIPYYLSGELKPFEQNESVATYTRTFTKEDGFVDAKTPAKIVERKIRAFDDWPKVYTALKDKKVQLLSSHFAEDGTLVIDRVKPEGKNEMSYADFQNGYRTKLTFTE